MCSAFVQVFLVLAFVGYCSAGLISTGTSTQSRSQDIAGNYAFAYDENHSTGGTFRRESGTLGGVTGSYGLRDIDGRVRIVNYIADGLGFRANVQTNEPGTDPKESAAVSRGPVAAPLLAPVAPVVPAPIAAAPLGFGLGYSTAVHHGLRHY
ncbi:hypothetical protein B4U80_08230 [Leptotrombidium deliense]|uniref:Uncharacterized protein n=1 Tax=Leptotrombidium deliense TaxID=299467 RepID=A0A443SG31_9ACAR|nr:hypothetical protein B4U80_08230 [Leptotrombidium deliense]